MKTIEEKIMDVDSAICDYIDLIEVSSRGRMSDAILKHLRDLLEHIAVKIYAENNPCKCQYKNVQKVENKNVHFSNFYSSACASI